MGTPRVGILMGSDSDWPKIKKVAVALEEFGIEFEVNVMSAQRTPHAVAEYATSAEERGLGVIIAAAGGAAHLAGVVAAHTVLPVIGIPVPTADLGGMDSLLATVQMPGDVPVASMAVGMGGPRNAVCLPCKSWATGDPELRAAFHTFKRNWLARLKRRMLTSKHLCPSQTGNSAVAVCQEFEWQYCLHSH